MCSGRAVLVVTIVALSLKASADCGNCVACNSYTIANTRTWTASCQGYMAIDIHLKSTDGSTFTVTTSGSNLATGSYYDFFSAQSGSTTCFDTGSGKGVSNAGTIEVKIKCTNNYYDCPIKADVEMRCTPSIPDDDTVDGGWSQWSACSDQCRKTRTCTEPEPANGGSACVGTMVLTCDSGPCAEYEYGNNGEPNLFSYFCDDGANPLSNGCCADNNFCPSSCSTSNYESINGVQACSCSSCSSNYNDYYGDDEDSDSSGSLLHAPGVLLWAAAGAAIAASA